MLKVTKKMQKALDKLNNAITNLPEFKEVMKTIPRNVAVTSCELMEADTKLTWGKDKSLVSYDGTIIGNADGKDHQYLVNICGLMYLSTKKSLKELAEDIQTAMSKCKKHSDPMIESLYVTTYLMDKLDWEMTDEVYPHMRMSAEGVFTAEKFSKK